MLFNMVNTYLDSSHPNKSWFDILITAYCLTLNFYGMPTRRINPGPGLVWNIVRLSTQTTKIWKGHEVSIDRLLLLQAVSQLNMTVLGLGLPCLCYPCRVIIVHNYQFRIFQAPLCQAHEFIVFCPNVMVWNWISWWTYPACQLYICRPSHASVI